MPHELILLSNLFTESVCDVQLIIACEHNADGLGSTDVVHQPVSDASIPGAVLRESIQCFSDS